MLSEDSRFNDPSIYLAGYDTEIDSGQYNVRYCAREVLGGLKRVDTEGRRPVMDWDRIIFVCHSLGGIVTRYMLVTNENAFADKEVGLVLIASPSKGTKWANRLSLISRVYGQEQVRELEWGNDLLTNLDAQFKDLKDEDRIPKLHGVEFCESYFIAPGPLFFLKWKWIPLRTKSVVVTEESAGNYFAAVRRIPRTDHFTCVKPTSIKTYVTSISI